MKLSGLLGPFIVHMTFTYSPSTARIYSSALRTMLGDYLDHDVSLLHEDVVRERWRRMARAYSLGRQHQIRAAYRMFRAWSQETMGIVLPLVAAVPSQDIHSIEELPQDVIEAIDVLSQFEGLDVRELFTMMWPEIRFCEAPPPRVRLPSRMGHEFGYGEAWDALACLFVHARGDNALPGGALIPFHRGGIAPMPYSVYLQRRNSAKH